MQAGGKLELTGSTFSGPQVYTEEITKGKEREVRTPPSICFQKQSVDKSQSKILKVSVKVKISKKKGLYFQF